MGSELARCLVHRSHMLREQSRNALGVGIIQGVYLSLRRTVRKQIALTRIASIAELLFWLKGMRKLLLGI